MHEFITTQLITDRHQSLREEARAYRVDTRPSPATRWRERAATRLRPLTRLVARPWSAADPVGQSPRTRAGTLADRPAARAAL